MAVGGIGVAVRVGDGVGDGPLVGVCVALGVTVGGAGLACGWCRSRVGETEAVRVAVGLGVEVAVRVRVAVGVEVGGGGEGVRVAVGVAVFVGVAVAVGEPPGEAGRSRKTLKSSPVFGGSTSRSERPGSDSSGARSATRRMSPKRRVHRTRSGRSEFRTPGRSTERCSDRRKPKTGRPS